MAKLLERIWKAATGQFFETEEEALKAERAVAIKAAVKAAYEASMADRMETYKQASAGYDRAMEEYHNRSGSDRRLPPEPPRDPRCAFRQPPDFEAHLTASLDAAGLLVPLDLTDEEPTE